MVLDTETEETAYNWLFTAFLQCMVLEPYTAGKRLKLANCAIIGYPGISAPENIGSSYTGKSAPIFQL